MTGTTVTVEFAVNVMGIGQNHDDKKWRIYPDIL